MKTPEEVLSEYGAMIEVSIPNSQSEDGGEHGSRTLYGADAAKLIFATLENAGYKIVRAEPSWEMVEAACGVATSADGSPCDDNRTVEIVNELRAALGASPTWGGERI